MILWGLIFDLLGQAFFLLFILYTMFLLIFGVNRNGKREHIACPLATTFGLIGCGIFAFFLCLMIYIENPDYKKIFHYNIKTTWECFNDDVSLLNVYNIDTTEPSIDQREKEKRNSKISKYFIINHTYVYKKHLRLNISKSLLLKASKIMF